jgi:hypothetical protein
MLSCDEIKQAIIHSPLTEGEEMEIMTLLVRRQIGRALVEQGMEMNGDQE